MLKWRSLLRDCLYIWPSGALGFMMQPIWAKFLASYDWGFPFSLVVLAGSLALFIGLGLQQREWTGLWVVAAYVAAIAFRYFVGN